MPRRLSPRLRDPRGHLLVVRALHVVRVDTDGAVDLARELLRQFQELLLLLHLSARRDDGDDASLRREAEGGVSGVRRGAEVEA